MTISFGPKLGFINNADIGEAYYDQFRQFLQGLDQVVQMSVLSTSVNDPPATPADGDAYLLLGINPTGNWTGFTGYIAVWDVQVTLVGTNTRSPTWVFYKPNPGWLVWNVTFSTLSVFDGTNWNVVSSGGVQAEVPIGSINGVNRNFALTINPMPIASVLLFLNGVFQIPNVNYVLSGLNISMNIAPGASSTLYAVYDYV